jgi:hypothetical protein
MKRTLLSIFSVCLLAAASGQSITFKDVAPIIRSKCATCHKPGQTGPFSLITYEDVAKRASFIKDVIGRGYMPPWKADNQYVHFANDRSLTDKEKSMIVQWIDNRAPRGDGPDTVELKQASIPGTSYFRKPDLALKAADTFHLTGDNMERYVIFKIPFELKDSANVEAIELYCSNKKLIHHANYAIHPVPDTAIDIYHTDALLNLTEDDRRKFDQYQPYRKTITYYGGWIPGTSYESYPKNIGWVMPKRGVILLTVHFAPSAADESVQMGVNLFFKKTPVERRVKVVSFGSGGIGERQIEPPFYVKANKVEKFTLEVTNPSEDQSVLYVWPHMHLLGKEYLAYAITPAGDTIRLVHIPRWDFRWQEIYRFKKLVRIPKGSVIHIEGTYDNTADNPFNPNSPPKNVFSYGDMKTTDEMMTLMMIFMPYKEGDENINLE